MANKKEAKVEDAVVKEEKPKVESEETVKETVKPKQTDEKKEEDKNFSDKVKDEFTNPKDNSKDFTDEEKQNGKAMAILSYIGLLCLIPFFAEKNNKYVQYHAKQGLNLIIDAGIACAACGIVCWTIFLAPIGIILGIAVEVLYVVLTVIGIVNACKNEAKDLPLVNKFRIIK